MSPKEEPSRKNPLERTEEEGEGENKYHPLSDIITFFLENLKVEMIPVMEEELRDLVENFGPQRVTTAIAVAALHPPDSPLPYIRAVLENERVGKGKEKPGFPTFGDAPNVRLTDNEVLDLVKKFGKSGAEARIDFLSQYKGSTGKKYESDYATILLWKRRGNPDATPWDPEPPDWHIRQEWLDSLQPTPAYGGPRVMTQVTCRKCHRQFNAVIPKGGVPRDVCQKCVRSSSMTGR